MLEPSYLSRRSLAAAIPLAAFAASPAATVPAFSASDPVLTQIELHRALRLRVNTMPDADGDPVFQAACADEEAAIQALGDMLPTSVAGAVAQLRYMAEVERPFSDDKSPLLRTVMSVAEALSGLHGRHRA